MHSGSVSGPSCSNAGSSGGTGNGVLFDRSTSAEASATGNSGSAVSAARSDPSLRWRLVLLVQRRPAAKRLELFDRSNGLKHWIVKPVRRPHPEDFPALVVQDLLSRRSRRERSCCCGTRHRRIRSGKVTLRKVRMADAKVDLVTRYADLVVDDEAARAESIGDFGLEVAVGSSRHLVRRPPCPSSLRTPDISGGRGRLRRCPAWV